MQYNKLKSYLFFGTLFFIFGCIGHTLASTTGLVLFTLLAFCLNSWCYIYGDRYLLHRFKAEEITAITHPHLFAILDELCVKLTLSVPQVYLIDDTAPNAFAVGRHDHAATIGITRGLLTLLGHRELSAVFAHELVHIKNGTIAITTPAVALSTLIGHTVDTIKTIMFGGQRGKKTPRRSSGFTLFFISLIIPLITIILRLSLSLDRVYSADRIAAQASGSRHALVTALEKIERYLIKERPLFSTTALATTGTLMLVYPYIVRGMGVLFETHPPLHLRIFYLKTMEI